MAAAFQRGGLLLLWETGRGVRYPPTIPVPQIPLEILNLKTSKNKG